MNLLKPQSNNKTANITFYIFEIVAAVICFIYFVMAIIEAVQFTSFLTFVQGFYTGVIYALILYGIGRIIDFVAPKENDEK